MKYKKQIATGALAISLLVSGSSVFAATPQDLGIKNAHQTYQRQNKNNNRGFGFKIKKKRKGNTVGTISAINDAGFVVEVKNIKTKIASSIDVKTDASTVYSKNGIIATASDLSLGQKVVVTGSLDKTTNILTAKTVKIVVNKKNL